MTEIIESEKLKQIVNKIETIEQERLESADLLKDVFNEAKSMGFDVKIIKHVIKLRKKDKDALAEEDSLKSHFYTFLLSSLNYWQNKFRSYMTLKKTLFLIMNTLLVAHTASAEHITSAKYPVASDLNVKINAYSAFESGFSSQNKLQKSEKKVSSNKGGFAFYNDSALSATISNKVDGIAYGGKIILVPTTKRKSIPTYNGSHVFIESEFGRIEAGSPIPVATHMMISDGSIPTKYIKTSTEHLKQEKQLSPSFLTSEGCFVGDDISANFSGAKYSSEPPRTINYYTPKFTLGNESKVQIGVSYTPDTTNTGIGSPSQKTDDLKKKTIGEVDLDRFEIDRAVKDTITAGILFQQKFKENIELKLALTGEHGKSAGNAKKYDSKDDKKPQEYKLSDLRSFNIGTELRVGNFTYSGCYGSFEKSLTTPELHKAGRKSHYYSVTTAYKYNATTAKLSYFASEQFKNRANIVKLNVSHLLAPGFKPYVEISSFALKGKPEFYPELSNIKTRGTVFLIGAKLTL